MDVDYESEPVEPEAPPPPLFFEARCPESSATPPFLLRLGEAGTAGSIGRETLQPYLDPPDNALSKQLRSATISGQSLVNYRVRPNGLSVYVDRARMADDTVNTDSSARSNRVGLPGVQGLLLEPTILGAGDELKASAKNVRTGGWAKLLTLSLMQGEGLQAQYEASEKSVEAYKKEVSPKLKMLKAASAPAKPAGKDEV